MTEYNDVKWEPLFGVIMVDRVEEDRVQLKIRIGVKIKAPEIISDGCRFLR